MGVFGGRYRELEHMQVDPSSQEFRDSREEVHIVHPISEKAKREVLEERQGIEVLPESDRGLALQDALEAQGLELMPVVENVAECR